MMQGVTPRGGVLATAVAFLLAGSTVVFAQAQDPLVGHWSLNAAKSTSSGVPPKKREVTITQKGAEITVAVNEVPAEGAPIAWSFTTKGDGSPVPVKGWAEIDTATSTLAGRTGKTIYSKAGKPVMESHTEVSADGKTLTVKGSRPGPDGKPVTFATVYDRK